jgi:hypothetical protein
MNARRLQYACGGVISLDGIRFVSFMAQPVEGEDRPSVLLAPDLGGPSSESDLTNATGLLDDGGDER